MPKWTTEKNHSRYRGGKNCDGWSLAIIMIVIIANYIILLIIYSFISFMFIIFIINIIVSMIDLFPS